MKSNVCSVCGKGTLKKEVIEEKFTYKGETTTIPDYIIYRCDLCNETIVDKATLKSSGKLLKKFKCKVDGLLTGDEIRKIRRKLELTQEEMSHILGGGLKGFARYETGQICQSKAMDNLLRVLDRFPQVLHFIQKTSEGSNRLHGACVVIQNTNEEKQKSALDNRRSPKRRPSKKDHAVITSPNHSERQDEKRSE